jgi:hypothetical protein
VETIKSYKMKCEDYFLPQATYAQLLTPRIGPMLMSKTQKGSRKVQKEEAHDVCTYRTLSSKPLSHQFVIPNYYFV